MASPKTTLSLGQYVKYRNGVAIGATGSLNNMLVRSFGASSIAKFWQYWNPIFGYYLGYRIFKPLKKRLPASPALFLTFLANGILHDIVTTVVRADWAFFFTPWFIFLGLGVVISEACRLNYAQFAWPIRAAINLSYVIACLGLTLQIGF